MPAAQHLPAGAPVAAAPPSGAHTPITLRPYLASSMCLVPLAASGGSWKPTCARRHATAGIPRPQMSSGVWRQTVWHQKPFLGRRPVRRAISSWCLWTRDPWAVFLASEQRRCQRCGVAVACAPCIEACAAAFVRLTSQCVLGGREPKDSYELSVLWKAKPPLSVTFRLFLYGIGHRTPDIYDLRLCAP